MRHTRNRIITPVTDNSLYLVEVRDKDGELLRTLPKCFHNSYKLANRLSREALSESNKLHTYKGYTLTKDGIRYKWITNECKFIEMIKPNTNNPCLNYITLRHSGHLTNYLQLFPEERFMFKKYREKVHEITKALHYFYKHVFVYKQIEKTDIPFALNPLIYDIHGLYLQHKQGISWDNVKQYIHELEPKRLCFAINNM